MGWLGVYRRTVIIGVVMAALAVMEWAWRKAGPWAVTVLAASVMAVEYGSDTWRDRYEKERRRRGPG